MARAGALAAFALLLAGAALLLSAEPDAGSGPEAGSVPTATGCDELGARDRNPTDLAVVPDHGSRLLGGGREPPIGFNDDAALVGALSVPLDLSLHEGAGSTLIRFPVDWRAAEPEPGRFELETHDEIYCAAVARGIRPILVLAGAPGWAAEDDRFCPGESCLAPPAADHLDDLRDFAELIAIRYPAAAAVEAWNEPNLAAFWAGPDPGAYADVLTAIYEGVKSGNPEMPVLGGSLSNTTRTAPAEGKFAGAEFADKLLAAGGARHMDAFAFHPYPIEPLGAPGERFSETMAALRGILGRHGAGRMRLWITEVGLPRRPASEATAAKPAISAAEQADSLLAIDRRLAASGDVDAILFHTLIDPPEATGDAPDFGWVSLGASGTLSPKPVYRRFASIRAR